MKLLPLLTALLLLGGCASPTKEVKNPTTVPTANIFATELLSPGPTRKIPVTIDLDSASAVSVTLKINSRDIARLAPGESLTIYLEYNAMTFGVSDKVFYSERREVIADKSPQRFRIHLLPASGPYISRLSK